MITLRNYRPRSDLAPPCSASSIAYVNYDAQKVFADYKVQIISRNYRPRPDLVPPCSASSIGYVNCEQ